MKAYLVGLAFIGLAIQPYFVGKLIGLNMDCQGCLGTGMFITALLEVAFICVLILPYIIGSKLLKELK